MRYWMKNHPADLIVNFDALTYAGNLENLKVVEKNPNYKFVKGDICDKSAVEKAMNDSDIVVHFAAETHVDRSIMDSQIFLKTNVLGSQILFEAALKNKIKKFIHISTDEVFGSLEHTKGTKFTELTSYAPRNPYSASKAAADFMAHAYHNTFGLPVIIMHSGNNYGPYQFPEKFIPLTIVNAIEGRKVPIYGDGLQIRSWVHVDDFVRAIDTAIQVGKNGEHYCVGGEEKANIEVAKTLLGILGKNENELEFIKDRLGHDRKYALDSSKIKLLGWEPKFAFEEGLKHKVGWYLENKEWWRRVLNGEYRNYYQKQYNQSI